MKVLNLYAGIGGNRKLWEDVEVTAVELDPDIAKIYQDYFPNDTVIVGDAHQYLLDHFKEFDFIWSSPPCPTHSRTNLYLVHQGMKHRYPDMQLYQEIILLDFFFDGKYCIENVMGYYEPLIKPQINGRHFFWSNFKIQFYKNFDTNVELMKGSKEERSIRKEKRNQLLGYELDTLKNVNKDKVLNNCVNPHIGKLIIENARGIITKQNEKQIDIFE